MQSPWNIFNHINASGLSFSNATLINDNLFILVGQNSGNWFQRYSFTENVFEDFYNGPFFSNTAGVACSIGGMLFFGLGNNGISGYSKEFYKYDPSGKSWSRLTDFPADGRMSSFFFAINNKLYVGAGFFYQTVFNDFWEYDPSSDSWSVKTDYPGGKTSKAVAFAVNNRAYIIDGQSLWVYDADFDTWNRKSDFPGASRYLATGFTIGNMLYFGTGNSSYETYGYSEPLGDFWRYDIVNDRWDKMPDLPSPRFAASGISYGMRGYIIVGKVGSVNLSDIIEYDPNDEY
jgi:N-acetylneuraminic acid mutarotase